MTSLGIDLSLTSTGIIKLEDGKIQKRQLIKTKPTGQNPLEELKRLEYIRDTIDTTDVDIAIIEGLAFMARNTTALVQLAGLNYLTRERFYLEEIPFIIVAPTTLKKFISGKGNCPKDLILLETYKRYHVSFKDDNLCDAYVLARIGEALLDKKVKLTKFQEEVINLINEQYEKHEIKNAI